MHRADRWALRKMTVYLLPTKRPLAARRLLSDSTLYRISCFFSLVLLPCGFCQCTAFDAYTLVNIIWLTKEKKKKRFKKTGCLMDRWTIHTRYRKYNVMTSDGSNCKRHLAVKVFFEHLGAIWHLISRIQFRTLLLCYSPVEYWQDTFKIWAISNE